MKPTGPKYIAVVIGSFAAAGAPEAAQVFVRGEDGVYRIAKDIGENYTARVETARAIAAKLNAASE